MKINRNNYEAYFIDYIEGNLDEKLVDDFLEFLQQNPDLKEELSLFQSVSLDPEDIQFTKKEQLYKNKFDLEDQFNHTSVALLEGDLNNDEKAEFEDYLNSHPKKQKEYKLFEKTKLHPDLSVKFSKKDSLYHRSGGKSILMWSVRIAAVVVLAITFYVLVDRNSPNPNEELKVAVVEKEAPKKEIPQAEKQTNAISSEQKEQPSEKVEKKEQKTEVKTENKPLETKETEPKKESPKSLRENIKGRIDESADIIERVPVEPLKPISRLTASLEIKQPQANLKSVQYTIPEENIYQEDERLLADVVIEKTGIDKLSFNKIAKAGLNIVSSISKEKLSYETNESGKVTEINYDSRLLAFSIPTKGETNK